MTKCEFGIVEGFFSRPLPMWTHQERMLTLATLRAFAPGVTRYYYCPKQDPYVTGTWAELYPQARLAELRNFVAAARAQGISCTFGINPTLDPIALQKPEERARWLKLAEQKLRQFLAIGATGVSILFDDLPLAYDVLDDKADRSAGVENTMVELTNALYVRLAGEIDEFLFCSPDYCYTATTTLTTAQRNLHAGIIVVTSGNEVFAPTITKEDTARIRGVLGDERQLAWWVNYPVNDCEHNLGVLNLGAFTPPLGDVLPTLTRIYVNPMRECAANIPLYHTLGQYVAERSSYERSAAWEKALQQLFGPAAEALELLTSEFSPTTCADKSPRYNCSALSECVNDGEVLRVVERVESALDALTTRVAPWSSSETGALADAFLHATAPLLHTARGWVSTATKALAAESISLATFAEGDLFPTSPHEPRYCAEIARIVAKRLNALEEAGVAETVAKDFVELQEKALEFPVRFKGREKLSLTPHDQDAYKSLNQRLIALEQDATCRVLNSQDLAARTKLLLLSRRSSVTRFTL